MISYKIKFILTEQSDSNLYFESNEKPFKGDVFKVQEKEGTPVPYKIIEVTKVIVSGGSPSATLEYHCVVEKDELKGNSIGFK
jgi:hypothetical protein